MLCVWKIIYVERHFYLFISLSELSTAELMEENVQLQQQTRELRRKCIVIRDLIDVLQKRYEASKSLGIFRRYSLLKTMIKSVIHDNLV